MLSSDEAKEQAQAQADTAKAQARKMLRTLCKFMLPVIRNASRQKMDLDQCFSEIEADEFVTELENFISGIISRSQPRNQDIAIETTLDEERISHSEDDEVMIRPSSNDKEAPLGNILTNQLMMQYDIGSPVLLVDARKEELEENLLTLRKHITQNMPIRLLCFEPHHSILKISLFERADIYNYLAPKLRADFALDKWSPDFVNQWISGNAGYAILSHTWNQTPGELTYGDWKNGSLDSTEPKCQKLVNFCKAAWEDHGLTLGWIDTVCINKESSAELDESIRSMYAWYSGAEVCITYLAATDILPDMGTDPWFTRGWTLQELLAPYRIKFYNKNWNQLSTASNNDKDNSIIQAEIKFATTITPDELQVFHGAPISRRMQLAAKRQVTRGEDIAYCLMGIFDVSISTAYGEGADRAFFRLIEEIFRTTKDVSDIFNWAGDRDVFSREPTSSLFPSHPADYLNRSTNEQLRRWHLIEPLTLTHLGLRVPILLMPAVPLLRQSVSPHPRPVGDYHGAVSVALRKNFDDPFSNPFPGNLPKSYVVLDKRVSGPEAAQKVKIWSKVMKIALAFGTLNVEEQGVHIRIPKTCLSVLLFQRVAPSSSAYEKVYTEKPIVFDLKKIRNNSDGDGEYYLVKRNKLVKHGMRLVTLYL